MVMTAFATMLDATSNTARVDPAQVLLKMNEGIFYMAVAIGIPIIHYDTKACMHTHRQQFEL